MAEARRRAAVRVRVRPHRNERIDHPRRRRTLLRSSGRQHGVLDPRQSAHRDVAGSAQRSAPDAWSGPEPRCRAGDDHLPVRREGRRRPGSGRRACRRRCPGRWSPTCRTSATAASIDSAIPGRHDRESERRRHRRRVSAAKPGSDAPGTSSVPGATAYTTNLLRPYRGLGNINQNTTEFRDLYHSLQVSVNRRYRNGFAFGANYTSGSPSRETPDCRAPPARAGRHDHAPR